MFCHCTGLAFYVLFHLHNILYIVCTRLHNLAGRAAGGCSLSNAQHAIRPAQRTAPLLLQESFECMSRDMIDNLVPPMAERIVAQRLRESVKEQGGLIHKDMLSFRADLAQLRQGALAD